MFTGGFEFKKVEIEQRTTHHGRTRRVYIHCDKDGKPKRLIISFDVFAESDINIGDKVDLLQCGRMFAFQKNNAGLLRITQAGSTGGICSQNLCRHLRVETRGCNEYEAWVDNGMIIFKPIEEHRTL